MFRPAMVPFGAFVSAECDGVGLSMKIRTKIIATLGPASDSEEAIGNLLDAGVDVFRLNFSHGSRGEHARLLGSIRRVSAARGVTVAVMGDLCGPKIRLGKIEGGSVELREGAEIDVVAEPVLGTARRISTSRSELIEEVRKGARILIDDGAITLRVREVLTDRLRCVCEVGGTLSDRKGVNLPDSDLAVGSLTEDDRVFAAWAYEEDLDYLALSFVRTADDIRLLRSLGRAVGSKTHIVAKIETPQAVAHIDELLDRYEIDLPVSA